MSTSAISGNILREQPLIPAILAMLWLMTALSLGLSMTIWPTLMPLKVTGGLLGAAFALLFSLYLLRLPPRAEEMPTFEPLFLHRAGEMQTVIGLILLITALIASTFVGGLSLLSVFILSIAAAGFTIFRLKSGLTTRRLATALALALAAWLLSRFVGKDSVSQSIINGVLTALFYTAGTMLVDYTGLIRLHLSKEEFTRGGLLFLAGTASALPFALFNLISEIYQKDSWVTEWWRSFYAMKASLVEEIWARLFLVTFIYALLRPIFKEAPRKALFWTVLTAGTLFTLAHTGFNIPAQLVGLIIFSIPKVLVYLKFGFEFALGFHFLTDFLRFLCAYRYLQEL